MLSEAGNTDFWTNLTSTRRELNVRCGLWVGCCMFKKAARVSPLEDLRGTSPWFWLLISTDEGVSPLKEFLQFDKTARTLTTLLTSRDK